MGSKAVLLAATTAFAASAALAKPLVYDPDTAQQLAVTVTNTDKAEAAQNCAISQHLREHISYTLETIIPRVHSEIPELLGPHAGGRQGRTFYSAERIDLSDLFHVHVRYPLTPSRNSGGTLPHALKDSSQYHLQYHSFETPALFLDHWAAELKNIKDRELQDWLAQRERILNSRQTSVYAGPTPTFAAAPLTQQQIAKFAELWHRTPHGQAESLERLKLKVGAIDPVRSTGLDELMAYRSIVSTHDRLAVLNTLNVDNYSQPLTVFFEPRQGNSVNAAISKAERQGVKAIINPAADGVREAYGSHINWRQHGQLMMEFSAAAQRSPNRLSVMRDLMKDDVERSGQQVITWDRDYVYSLHYSVPCRASGPN